MVEPDPDDLAAIADQLRHRVRTHTPEDNARWLDLNVAGPEWPALAIVLAAAVPVNVPFTHLTAWALTRQPARPQPRH